MERTTFQFHGDGIRSLTVGLLFAFIFFTLKELAGEPVWFVGAIAVMAGAIVVAKKTAQHFHLEHTHAGDSPFDAIALSVLFVANILHPAVDGFSLYETFVDGGKIAGFVFLGGVVIHEFFRQAAIVSVFKTMGVKWFWVIGTALFGIALGVGMGRIGSHVLHAHEEWVDLATLFAYVFIVSEFYNSAHHREAKHTQWFVLGGVLLGTLLSLFVRAH